MRKIGPLLPEQRVARENLKAAFPEKSAADIETILNASWDNLGRMGAEFANLDRLWQFDADAARERAALRSMRRISNASGGCWTTASQR